MTTLSRYFDPYIAEMANYTPMQQERYRKELMAMWNEKNILDTARMDGERRVEARGKAEGKAEIARSMKAKGYDAAVIADLTGLSREEIENLR